MAKLAQNFAKYMILARMHTKGVVERPDVIGAIFGQTEGLLGGDLDLRELQRTGRIGRIEVDVKMNKGKSYVDITIPSSLDASETALIAASLETIDKVGPCDAEVEIVKVDDVRSQKRQYVIERAKDILRAMIDVNMPDSQKISEIIKEAVRSYEVSNYQGLTCGPGILEADEIIIVEGRADVINLLKNGIKNVIAFEGSKVPEALINLTKEKTTTAFLDGDRGGDLDLKKLIAIADVDYVTRAELGKEVEELSKKQIFKALRERIPVDQAFDKKPEYKEEKAEEQIDPELKKTFGALLDDLIGTRAAYLVDNNMQVMSKVPIAELNDMVDEFKNIHAIIFDGKINQMMVDMTSQRKISYLVGMEFGERVRGPIKTLIMKDLKS